MKTYLKLSNVFCQEMHCFNLLNFLPDRNTAAHNTEVKRRKKRAIISIAHLFANDRGLMNVYQGTLDWELGFLNHWGKLLYNLGDVPLRWPAW